MSSIRDLAVQQRALAEFAAVSQDGGSNYNSSRVTKAREKLAKLSFAQFRELSTDVYDELQRRISESPGQPAHLEPRSNLIPKRNEARQRLASLPSVRFGDLINDILFEIERRQEIEGLKPTAPEVQVSPSPPEPSLEGNQRGIFPQTVVPKKAALSWSSDEEEEEEPEPERQSVLSSLRSEKLELSRKRDTWTSFSDDEAMPVLKNSAKESPVREIPAGNDHMGGGRALSNHELERDHLERDQVEGHLKREDSASVHLEQKNRQMEQKSNEMQQKINHLEQQLEQQEHAHVEELERFKRAQKQLTENLNGQRMKLQTAASEKLKLDNQLREIQYSLTSKEETIKKLENACKSMENHHNQLRKEHSNLLSQVDSNASRDNDTLWRARCEKARSEGIESLLNTPKNKFSKVIGKKGMISSKAIADFTASLEILLVSLQDPVDAPALFDLVGNVCSHASSVMRLVSLDEAANQVKLVNATLSHLVTAARYFVMYNAITSRAVVVTAANEVVFCLCDLLEIARLHEQDPVEKAQPFTPVIDRFTPAQDVSSPVRPLKMTQRLNSPDYKRRSDLESSRVRLKNGSGTPFQLKNSELGNDGNTTPFQLKQYSDDSLSANSGVIADGSPSRISKQIEPKSRMSEPKKMDLGEPILTDDESARLAKDEERNGRSAVSELREPNVESKASESKLVDSKISLSKLTDSKSRESKLSQPNTTHLTDENSGEPVTSQQPPTETAPAKQISKPLEISEKSNSENIIAPSDILPKEIPVETNKIVNPTPAAKVSSKENVPLTRQSRELKVPQETNEPLEEIPQRNRLRESREDLNELPDKNPRRLKPESIPDNSFSNRNRASERFSNDSARLRTSESNNRMRQSNGSSASASPHKRSPKSNQIMNRVKQFENAPPEPVKPKTMPKSLSSNSIERFGERTRNSSNASSQQNNGEIFKNGEEESRLVERDMRKSIDAANFNVETFDILNPDNTLNQLLLYLEHQTVAVISTIQTLLSSIKQQNVQRGVLKESAGAINFVVEQMTEATNSSMSQTRNAQLREHGRWVVESLVDCDKRMKALCNQKAADSELADKNFKQRLAGVSFDIARCTKELVKSVEEAAIKEEIAILDARMSGENLL